MFARIGRLVRGFLSLFISGIEEANPEALMAAARDDFRSKMAQYNMALARMAGVASSAASWPTIRPGTWSSPAPSPANCRSSRRT